MLMTIGHSTLTTDAFVDKCRSHGVRTIIDVRSHPTSRWEWFEREKMEQDGSWLKRAHIGYRWIPELGGWNDSHAQDQALCDYMLNRGVDVAAYGHGYFPKQRIAGSHRTATEYEIGDLPKWTNQGLYDYAWFTSTGQFLDAALSLARESQPGYSLDGAAMMCSEYVWWKCHRASIADVLVAAGYNVMHVMPKPASHRSVIGNRLDRYPEQVRAAWRAAFEQHGVVR